jgi:hypothetical protein
MKNVLSPHLNKNPMIATRIVGARPVSKRSYGLCAPTHHETPFFTNFTVGARGPSPLHNPATPFITNHSTLKRGSQ